MARDRMGLSAIFKNILGNNNVYFQKPENLKMKYPCIRYKVNNIPNMYADDSVYIQEKGYEVMVIDENPDSEIVEAVSKIPRTRFLNTYEVDNLYHTIFQIYY